MGYKWGRVFVGKIQVASPPLSGLMVMAGGVFTRFRQTKAFQPAMGFDAGEPQQSPKRYINIGMNTAVKYYCYDDNL